MARTANPPPQIARSKVDRLLGLASDSTEDEVEVTGVEPTPSTSREAAVRNLFSSFMQAGPPRQPIPKATKQPASSSLGAPKDPEYRSPLAEVVRPTPAFGFQDVQSTRHGFWYYRYPPDFHDSSLAGIDRVILEGQEGVEPSSRIYVFQRGDKKIFQGTFPQFAARSFMSKAKLPLVHEVDPVRVSDTDSEEEEEEDDHDSEDEDDDTTAIPKDLEGLADPIIQKFIMCQIQAERQQFKDTVDKALDRVE